jgi:hypothetical protein
MTKFLGKKVIKIFIFYPNPSFLHHKETVLRFFSPSRPESPAKKKLRKKRARTCTCKKFLVTLQRFFNYWIK